MSARLALLAALALGVAACDDPVRPENADPVPSTASALIGTTTLSIVDLGTLGGPMSQARGINNHGQVVGLSRFGPSYYNHFFLWEKGVMRDLGTMGGHSAEARAINDEGQVVGFSYGNTGTYHAALWDPGTGWTDLGTIGAARFSFAHDINSAGEVVGSSEGTAFIWTPASGMQPLGTNMEAYGMSDTGFIVGRRSAPVPGHQYHGFRWTATGGFQDLTTLGGISAYAFDVNRHGVAVGWAQNWLGQTRAVMWGGSYPYDLGTLGGTTSRAYAIND